ncbi:glycoside hydrolase family 25 protein [Sphingomonas sp. G124]|uniref:Glycoside hydrolase family 25 protein n=1 Tax=Sphingomonas cremea TaxID=2904799 RepID=A0A9X1QMS3_9SPHN|nr:glycoside hydrolase family 25 protein [Sphingomonas cremea]MCF2514877.1 glycoside hydrolase family 25 protein [Sphingomonas cremea]
MAINAVIDISHHNGTRLDFAKAKAEGIIGVIHKASQGQANVDPMYRTNRNRARAAGLLWGAYHFATGSDGVKQAVHFLNTVGDITDTLLVLDFEPNPSGPSMSLEEARAFNTHVFGQTQQWPGLYAGHYLKELLGTHSDPVLAKSWLWVAQYGPTPVVPPNWPTWTMWQYTDGAAGPVPHRVSGIGRCDRDKFNGSEAQLRRLWGVAA